MKICVLQPDYSGSHADYGEYDPPRDLTDLLPGHQVDHVAIHKLTTFRQLKHLARQGYDIFLNLCEGYPDWDVPGIDVVDALERLDLPFTGPGSLLYDVPKPLMKYVAHSVGVRTPMHALIRPGSDVVQAVAGLRFPLFVKPAHAGDSLGVDAESCVTDLESLEQRAATIAREFGEALVEEYVDGREFTVLVVASAEHEGEATALRPVEFRFPEGTRFKTYALKTSELHPESNVPVTDDLLAARLRSASLQMFKAFGGVGYARFDFRQGVDGELHFLDVNFTCSVFYRDGYEGSADYILRYDGLGQSGFAAAIIAEGIARHRRTRKPFETRGNAIAGYGIFATRPIPVGEVVWRGEGRAQRVVTRKHVESTWSADDRALLRRYGYPLGEGVYAIWSQDPLDWAPQNHSCAPNTGMDGLNLVARRDIAEGEELTLDYAELLGEESEPFDCACGAVGCRGRVTGTPGNSVSARTRVQEGLRVS